MENDPLVGQQLGAYTIQSKLGEGGMASVYKAYHARLRREVAIKVILPQIAGQADFKVRFEREAQLIASLQHPNIVAVYDFGDSGHITYLVMQFVGGGTLRDRMRGGRALDPRQATLYTIQMGKGLHHAHLRGIVHRDVKPQNMLIPSNDPNQLLLSDFGIAKLYDTRHEPTLINPAAGRTIGNDASLTSMGQIVGTADYMAPEQIEARPVDARTDVYALGVVLFQMLTGEAPFRSTTVQGLLYQHVYTAPPPVREVNPYVSEQLAWIVSKAMAKAPSDRFQSAEEMAQALEAANSNATYRLAPSESQLPLVRQDTREPITPPLFNRPQSGPPNTGAAFQSGQVQPALPAKRRLPLSYIGAGLVILLAIVLILSRTGLFNFGNTSTNQVTPAQSFIETFQDNSLQWLNGSSNGLNATINPHSYMLDIPAANSTYFPFPKNVGYLPTNFTWSVTIEQTSGPTTTFYGLAFRLTENGSAVSCYAFAIDSQGNYQVLKYNSSTSAFDQIATGTSTANKVGIRHLYDLKVRVQGSNFYFSINDTPVNGGQAIKDNVGGTPYTGGEPALYVTGSANTDVTYIVMRAQLIVG
jgi:serine/threonine-protein kinase